MDPNQNILNQLGNLNLVDISDLQGLGVAPNSPAAGAIKNIAQKAGARAINAVTAHGVLDRDEKQLLARLQKLNPNAAMAINTGKAMMRDWTVYQRYTLGATVSQRGQIGLIDSNQTLLPGITNLKQGQLPQGYQLLVTHVSVRYGVGGVTVAGTIPAWFASDTDADELLYTNGHAAATVFPGICVPKAILNGELQVQIQNAQELFLTMADFFAQTSETVGGQRNNFVAVKSPFLIQDNEQVQFTFNAPQNQGLAGTVVVFGTDGIPVSTACQHGLEVRLKGKAIVPRGNK